MKPVKSFDVTIAFTKRIVAFDKKDAEEQVKTKFESGFGKDFGFGESYDVIDVEEVNIRKSLLRFMELVL